MTCDTTELMTLLRELKEVRHNLEVNTAAKTIIRQAVYARYQEAEQALAKTKREFADAQKALSDATQIDDSDLEIPITNVRRLGRKIQECEEAVAEHRRAVNLTSSGQQAESDRALELIRSIYEWLDSHPL